MYVWICLPTTYSSSSMEYNNIFQLLLWKLIRLHEQRKLFFWQRKRDYKAHTVSLNIGYTWLSYFMCSRFTTVLCTILRLWVWYTHPIFHSWTNNHQSKYRVCQYVEKSQNYVVRKKKSQNIFLHAWPQSLEYI